MDNKEKMAELTRRAQSAMLDLEQLEKARLIIMRDLDSIDASLSEAGLRRIDKITVRALKSITVLDQILTKLKKTKKDSEAFLRDIFKLEESLRKE